MQKRLNLSICRFDCGIEWAEECTSSIVFARWRQYALVEGHVAVTCRITLNDPSTAATRLMANYFDGFDQSLDTLTYTVAQIVKRFEPRTLLWAFHTIQHLVSFINSWHVYATWTIAYTVAAFGWHHHGLMVFAWCRLQSGDVGHDAGIAVDVYCIEHAFFRPLVVTFRRLLKVFFYFDNSIRTLFVTFCVSRRRRKMYCGHARLCVCVRDCPRPYAHTTTRTRM